MSGTDADELDVSSVTAQSRALRWALTGSARYGDGASAVYGTILTASLLIAVTGDAVMVMGTIALTVLVFWLAHVHVAILRRVVRTGEHVDWAAAHAALIEEWPLAQASLTPLAPILLAALAYQLVVVGSVYCAFHVVDVRIPNASVLAYVPAVAMVQVIPITIGGLGVREGMLAFLFHPLGVPTGRAVAVGLLWYGMTLLVSLLGAPAFAVGHRRSRTGGRPEVTPEASPAVAPAGARPGSGDR